MKSVWNPNPIGISIGQVLCTPKTIKAHSTFTAIIYLLMHEESGTHIPLIENDKPTNLFVGCRDNCSHQTSADVSNCHRPGTYAHITVTLALPLAMEAGTRFEVKKMGTCIGIGVVTEVA